MKLPQRIFLASGNRHKIEELEQLLHPLGIGLTSALDSSKKEVEEDQPDLRGNALKKAEFWFAETGIPSLADDTGLEVDVLNGAPGVFSARYAGEDASYSDNVNKLLKELSGETKRSARFRTAIAFVTDGERYTFEGVCSGEILKERKGDKGFGYDPIFRPDGYEKTFAELSADEKNKISHRGKALEKFIAFLRNWDKEKTD